MSQPANYTVAWICAITTEYVAAQASLDEKHDGPEFVSSGDNNDYSLGKIGKHNVVIAVLPEGEYGISSAATVARDMLHTFPNIRFGLMVGIGGGAPSPKHDIRLGDVVVSCGGAGKGGVLQYDFGKAMQNESENFRLTGFLNRPPTILRTAVNGLQAQYEMDGHQLQARVDSVIEKKPRLKQKYIRPEPQTDRLYQASFAHSREDSDCETNCGSEPSNLVSRPLRSEEDNITIHYGVIASANQLMKNGLVREKLATEHDILCFEMEAAGLMNHFPCLVVRGICDYSDSHKNKDWQGYAAMTAAAYTKDLLCRIVPSKIEQEKKIIDILSHVNDGVEKLVKKHSVQEQNEKLNWLTTIDYASHQHDYFARREEGTGQWLLDSQEYCGWFYQTLPQKTLFCPGMPGAGKTILTSVVINHLYTRFGDQQDIGIAYIYFNYKLQQQQTPSNLLLSLCKQLAQRQSSVPQCLDDLFARHSKTQTRPSLDEITRLLQSLVDTHSRTFLIFDALDECQFPIGTYFPQILKLRVRTSVNVFATSRFNIEIERTFKSEMSLEIRANDQDVQKFVDRALTRSSRWFADKNGLGEEIKVAITSSVDGMFLLAQLHLDSLTDKTSKKALRTALERLPRGVDLDAYDKAYGRALDRIQGQSAGFTSLARSVLGWLTFTRRPLTVIELQHALAIEPETSEFDGDNIPAVEDMISVCAGLVTIDAESSIIRLVHFTAQEYFGRLSWLTDAQFEITLACITYLSYDSFSKGSSKIGWEFVTRMRSYPLYKYAALNWGFHARELPGMPHLLLDFLRDEAKVSACNEALCFFDDVRNAQIVERLPKHALGIHLAAYFGLEDATASLVATQSPEHQDSVGHTPLFLAAMNGHTPVVSLLLATDGVDPDLKDKKGRTPLSWAAASGQLRTMELLLGRDGVDVNSRDNDGRTPLAKAAELGQTTAVERLLAMPGIDLNSRNRLGRTPLLDAAARGHDMVVKLLVSAQGVNLNLPDDGGRTPLSWAAMCGHEAVVKVFLTTPGVDLNAKDDFGLTPFGKAAESGTDGTLKVLLGCSEIDVDSPDWDYGQTPLSCAAAHGHETTVQLLLDTKRVNPRSKDNEGRTPLAWALTNGFDGVVKILREVDGVEQDSRDISGGIADPEALEEL